MSPHSFSHPPSKTLSASPVDPPSRSGAVPPTSCTLQKVLEAGGTFPFPLPLPGARGLFPPLKEQTAPPCLSIASGLGDTGVGKSSIVWRFVEDSFDPNINPTIGSCHLNISCMRRGTLSEMIADSCILSPQLDKSIKNYY
ncbi:hypothetical protein H8959_022828 [Pygathrix nigripes]